MIKLYHMPKTRSARVRWALEELGLPYQLSKVDLSQRAQFAPEFLAINPQGTVPVLQDGNTTISESGAILLYLFEKYPNHDLMPGPGSTARPLFFQWLFFAAATLEPHVITYYHHTVKLPPEQRLAPMLDISREGLMRAATTISSGLAASPYILGQQFTGADILLVSMLNLARAMKMTQTLPQNVDEYIDRVRARPAFQAALKD